MLRRASLTALALVLLPATVQAFDHHEHHHHDSDSDGGGGCSSASTHASSSGTPSTTVPATPAATSDNKHVFVTSTTLSGAIGGVAAADMYCQSAATAGGLHGTFRAWISDVSNNAYDRMGDVGPWYTTGTNAVAFASKADLLGAPRSELLDEAGGTPQTLAGAWTGTDEQGAVTNATCEGWTNATIDATATTGTGFSSDTAWGGGVAALPCNAQAPLICFQQ